MNRLPTERPRKRLRSLPAALLFGRRSVTRLSVASQRHYYREAISVNGEEEEVAKGVVRRREMNHLLAKKKPQRLLSAVNGQRQLHYLYDTKRSARGEKRPIQESELRTVLETQGDSYMGKYKPGVTETSESSARCYLTASKHPERYNISRRYLQNAPVTDYKVRTKQESSKISLR